MPTLRTSKRSSAPHEASVALAGEERPRLRPLGVAASIDVAAFWAQRLFYEHVQWYGNGGPLDVNSHISNAMDSTLLMTNVFIAANVALLLREQYVAARKPDAPRIPPRRVARIVGACTLMAGALLNVTAETPALAPVAAYARAAYREHTFHPPHSTILPETPDPYDEVYGDVASVAVAGVLTVSMGGFRRRSELPQPVDAVTISGPPQTPQEQS